jgi:hypothetical protein
MILTFLLGSLGVWGCWLTCAKKSRKNEKRFNSRGWKLVTGIVLTTGLLCILQYKDLASFQPASVTPETGSLSVDSIFADPKMINDNLNHMVTLYREIDPNNFEVSFSDFAIAGANADTSIKILNWKLRSDLIEKDIAEEFEIFTASAEKMHQSYYSNSTKEKDDKIIEDQMNATVKFLVSYEKIKNILKTRNPSQGS